MNIQGKAKDQIEKLVKEFQSGNVVESVSKIVIVDRNIPSFKWSMLNRWMAYAQTGDTDSRGFRQWEQAGRSVNKGEKAAYILRPIHIKKTVKNEETGEESDTFILIGYGSIPVFGASQTTGTPLEYEKAPEELPALNEIASDLGISIKYTVFGGAFYGCYDFNNKITLYTHDEQTFLHELSHAIHQKVCGNLKGGQHPSQEIVAEFCSCVLARMYGKKTPNEGNSYKYIERYAQQIKKSVPDSILSFMSDIVKVLDYIIEKKESLSIATAA